MGCCKPAPFGGPLVRAFVLTIRHSPVIILAFLIASPRAGYGGDAQRGRVIFTLAAGCGCHTGPDGPIGAGGGKVPTPFGTFYGTNITPDDTTGIGAWSDAEIAAAIRDLAAY